MSNINNSGNNLDFENLKLISDLCRDFLFCLDVNINISYFNNWGAALFDYEPEEFSSLNFLDLTSQENKLQLINEIAKANEGVVHKFESVFITKLNRIKYFEIYIRSLKDSDNNIIGYSGLARDISRLKSLQNEIDILSTKLIEKERLLDLERSREHEKKSILEELNLLKNEFVSNISHELRTPLASIIGFSETISSDPDMPKDMQLEFNEVILNEGKRLAKLINDILDLSKLEVGQLVLNKTEFNAIDLLKEVIEVNKKGIEQKKQTFTFDIPVDEAILFADRERIFQVITGLITNASKFTPEKGRINLSARILYRELEIDITDTGVGIPQKDLPFIFQKFYKVSRPGTEIPGTGLGLVFVKQLVDLHKGLIHIESEVNKGTSVVVKLPRITKG